MAERIVKNQTANIIYINDLGAKEIPAYGEIDLAACFNLSILAESNDLALALVKDVADNGFSQYLILNDGDNDLSAINAIDLIRDIQQKSTVTEDGDWKIVLKDSSYISTNRVIDKNITRYLAPSCFSIKKFKIPQDKSWFIKMIGGSAEPTCAQVDFYFEEDGIMINSFVDACTDHDILSAQVINPQDTIIYVNNFNNEIDQIQAGKHYAFEYADETDDYDITRKIISVDKGNNTIIIEEPLGVLCDIGTYIALVEKPIRSLVFEKVSSSVSFLSPISFNGLGDKFIVLKLINTDSVDDCKVTCFINGWEEPLQ